MFICNFIEHLINTNHFSSLLKKKKIIYLYCFIRSRIQVSVSTGSSNNIILAVGMSVLLNSVGLIFMRENMYIKCLIFFPLKCHLL